jgi:hypothetical protein
MAKVATIVISDFISPPSFYFSFAFKIIDLTTLLIHCLPERVGIFCYLIHQRLPDEICLHGEALESFGERFALLGPIEACRQGKRNQTEWYHRAWFDCYQSF